ncbi:hypothetical protein A8B78_01270 [Jannaschia sp. EhC01]|nr:hypothetical protein A8B78_01270 [Jannaschia sp. EhC01]
MLSILPFLLVGLGLSFFLDNDDDSDAASATPDDGLALAEVTGGDLLDFVEGMDLAATGEAGAPAGGDLDSATLIGGEGDDTITGGTNDDVLEGAGGDDEILGGPGADQITGGPGNDTLDGGNGDDVIEGGAGADEILGGLGNDTIDGGDDADVIDGGVGDDQIFGGLGDDTLSSPDGADTLLGGAGNDVLDGTSQGLFLPASPNDPTDAGKPSDDARLPVPDGPVVEPPAPVTGDQLLDGGAGDDVLIGDNADTLTGGDGTDSFVVDLASDPTQGSVLITDFDPLQEVLTLNVDGFDVGNPARDGFAFDVETRDLSDDSGMEVLVQGVVVATLAGVSEADGITISLVAENAGTANPGTFTNLGDGDDTAMGDLFDDTVNGGAGNDFIEGSAGRDVLNGGTGDDTLDGGTGRDDLSGGTGNDLLIGGGNEETPVTMAVQEQLDGGEGDDTLRSGDGFVALTGGEGTDVFEITRTALPVGVTVDPFGLRVTEVTDLDVATEEVNISLVNGDASAVPVPFTLEDLPDGSGVGVFIGGEIYVVLNGVLAADAPTVSVTSAAA